MHGIFKHKELSQEEADLTNKLIKIGEPHGLGLELAAIGIVETRLGNLNQIIIIFAVCIN